MNNADAQDPSLPGSLAHQLANENAGHAAVSRALLAKYEGQPSNTRKQYAYYQKDWSVGLGGQF